MAGRSLCFALGISLFLGAADLPAVPRPLPGLSADAADSRYDPRYFLLGRLRCGGDGHFALCFPWRSAGEPSLSCLFRHPCLAGYLYIPLSHAQSTQSGAALRGAGHPHRRGQDSGVLAAVLRRGSWLPLRHHRAHRRRADLREGGGAVPAPRTRGGRGAHRARLRRADRAHRRAWHGEGQDAGAHREHPALREGYLVHPRPYRYADGGRAGRYPLQREDPHAEAAEQPRAEAEPRVQARLRHRLHAARGRGALAVPPAARAPRRHREPRPCDFRASARGAGRAHVPLLQVPDDGAGRGAEARGLPRLAPGSAAGVAGEFQALR